MSENSKEIVLFSVEDFGIEKEELEVVHGGGQLGSDTDCTTAGNIHVICDFVGDDMPAPLD